MSNSSKLPKQILVCQYHTCLKDGSAKVLEALQLEDLLDYTVSSCGCLGLCGSGPMVLVLPDNTYYWHMNSNKVKTVVKRHLHQGEQVTEFMHPRLHIS